MKSIRQVVFFTADSMSLVAVGVYLSLWLALALVVASVGLAIWLMVRWTAPVRKWQPGEPFTPEHAEPALRAIIITMLLVPGLISDLYALWLMIPPVRRRFIARWVAHAAAEKR